VHALEIRGTVRVKAQRVHLRVLGFRLPKSGPLLSPVTDKDPPVTLIPQIAGSSIVFDQSF
jgi:hypothetical protein